MISTTDQETAISKGSEKAQLHVQVDSDMLDNIDRVAEDLGLSRSAAARLLINFAVKEKKEGNLSF